MEQVQQDSSDIKKPAKTNWIFVGLVILFFVVAAAAAFLTFNYVKDFVASWNITDLPGIVVKPGAEPTENSPQSETQVAKPPAVVIGPEPIPWDGASRVNILVMGIDQREHEEGPWRTDTMLVLTIDPANYRRYTPLVNLLAALDTRQTVAVYKRLYPLFQEAYEGLGYPDAYINDRLIEVTWDGRIVWEWTAAEHIDEFDFSDEAHVNGITIRGSSSG